MFGIGMPELLVIAGLALILIGPKKLPDLARSIGKTLGELRKATDDLKGTISEEINTIKDDMPNQAELEEALKKKFLGAEEEEKGRQGEEGQEEESCRLKRLVAAKQTFIEHLEELRKRLIISLHRRGDRLRYLLLLFSRDLSALDDASLQGPPPGDDHDLHHPGRGLFHLYEGRPPRGDIRGLSGCPLSGLALRCTGPL